jgi:hypothetical protein
MYNGEVVAAGVATAKLSGRERRISFQLPAFRSWLAGCRDGRFAVLLEIFILQAVVANNGIRAR